MSNSATLPHFLSVFFPDSNEPIHLRVFGPKGAEDKPEYSPQKLVVTWAALPDFKNELLKLNKTRGVYFAVNSGGDCDKDITRFNAVVVESDSQSILEQHEALDKSPGPTSIRVQTLKSVHAYWLLKPGCTEVQWRQIQAGLLAYFGGDPKIKNPSRVMRLPYFNHVSLNGDGGLHFKRVELVQFEPASRYSADELLGFFPVSNSESELESKARVVHTIGSYQTWDELNSELRRQIASHKTATKRPDGWIHCKGICHQGKSDSAIALNPATGAFLCQAGCSTEAILAAFGLPEKPASRVRVSGIDSSLGQANSEDSIQEEFSEEETMPQLTLEPEAFHGIAGEIVRMIEPHTESDPAALLSQFLIALGNLIGHGPYVKADGGLHGTNLFAVLVGKTSKARKGTSWGWIHSIMKVVDPDWEANRIAGGLSSGEGLIYAIRDPLEKDPGVTDKRLLVVETEFSAALKAMNREGCTLSPIIRQAFDRQTLRTLTRNSPISATCPHVSIIGHITSDELKKRLSEVECWNGFSNRFLWLYTRRSKLLPEGGKLDSAELERFFGPLKEAVQRAGEIGEINRSEEFRRRWAEVYPALSTEHPGLLGAVIGRAEALTLRLSLLYALLDRSPLLREEHLRAALAIWQYAEDSARLVFGEKAGDPLSNRILGHLRQAEAGRLSRTDISNKLGRHQKAERIDEALDTLRRLGLADRTQQETEGRRIEIWRIRSAKQAN
jgi:hypothetical protein